VPDELPLELTIHALDESSELSVSVSTSSPAAVSAAQPTREVQVMTSERAKRQLSELMLVTCFAV